MFGELNIPEPIPTKPSQSAGLPVGAVLLRGSSSPREGDGRDQHPEGGERARAAAVGPDPRQRRGDQHPDRHRRELDPGGDRVVALDALEVEDEDEEQGEAGEAVDEGGAGGGGEQSGS